MKIPYKKRPPIAPINGLIPAVDLVFLFMVFAYLQITKFLKTPVSPGEFGDMFGGVNSLFSGLAFAGIILSIFLQSKELGLQREELKLTREELKGQREVMTLQQSILERQQFESTLFKMLSLLEQIVNSIDVGKGDNQKTGRDCFITFLTHVRSGLIGRPRSKENNYTFATPNPAMAALAYEKFYDQKSNEIGHYFRLLYHIVRYIDDSSVANKYTYVRIVRAQLSSGELALLLLNCNTDLGQKFKPLVEKYAILKHTPSSFKGFSPELVSEIKATYSPSAFGITH